MKLWLLSFASFLMMAAAPAWIGKPIPQWTEEDARHVLDDSPWAKTVAASALPALSEEQRREGGATGGGKGAGLKGYEGITLLGAGKTPPQVKTAAHGVVLVRWESALPVRAAEMKAREVGAPDLESDDYAIAVYQVPGLNIGQKSLAREIGRTAVLKRDGKKDLKPSKVLVLPQDSGLATVVYLFPRSGEISLADQRIEFTAQIGRIVVTQYFYTGEMQFQGKLEL